MAEQLKSFFVTSQDKRTLEFSEFNQSLSSMILDLENKFSEDREYRLTRILEIQEKEWKEKDYDI